MAFGKDRVARLQTHEVSGLTELCVRNLLMLLMETRLPESLCSTTAGKRVLGCWFWSERASLAHSVGCVEAIALRLASKFAGEIGVADCALLAELTVHF